MITWVRDNLGWRRRVLLFAFLGVVLLASGDLFGFAFVGTVALSELQRRDDDLFAPASTESVPLLLVLLPVWGLVHGVVDLGAGHQVQGWFYLGGSGCMALPLLTLVPEVLRKRSARS